MINETIRQFFASFSWWEENQGSKDLTEPVDYTGPELDYSDWLRYGIERGYCTHVFCNTHDGYPMHESEEEAWDEGYDPCAFMVRLGTSDDWDISDPADGPR